MAHLAENPFNGLKPIEGREAHFYQLENGSDFRLEHLEATSEVLGLARDGSGLIDGQYVRAETGRDEVERRHMPHGEILVDHRLTEDEIRMLGDLGIKPSGPLEKAA